MFNVASNYRRIINYLSSIRVSSSYDEELYNAENIYVHELSLGQLSEYMRVLQSFAANAHPYVDEEALQEAILDVEEELDFRTTL